MRAAPTIHNASLTSTRTRIKELQLAQSATGATRVMPRQIPISSRISRDPSVPIRSRSHQAFLESTLMSARRTEHREVTAVWRYVVALLAAPTGSATKLVDMTNCYLECC